MRQFALLILCWLAAAIHFSAQAAAPTYLLSEGFEGTGYENSGWAVPPNSTSAPDPDYTATALLGEQSLRCNGVSFIQRPFVRNDPIYCYLRVRWATWSDYKFVVDWLDAGQASTATLLTSFGNKLEIKHGSVSVPGTTIISLNTTYHIWIEWTQGSGSDGRMKLFVSTDGTKPAAPEVNIVNGNGVATALFDVGPFGAGVDVVYDSILIDDEVIGSNPGGNAPPSISSIANQATPENTATPAITFIIGDAETNAADLTVTGSSSNQSVIPDANISFGGSESNRTVTLTPAENQSGIATITVTVSDGTSASSSTFIVTVGTANSAPTISTIANQSTTQAAPTTEIPFTIGDAQTAAESLNLGATSSNPALAPVANIVFGGSGPNRTVTVTPATGESGTTTITIRVDDGQLTNSTSFTLSVGTVNTPPTISAIAGQSVQQDTPLGPINFTIGDVETLAEDLTISGSSSNPALLPNESLAFGGTDGNRTLSLTPGTGQFGTSVITVTVSDGELTTSRNFLVTVIPTGTGSPSGFLFEEGFENGGYENPGWIEIGLPDPDHTNTVLRGAQSMNLTDSEFIYRNLTATNNFSLYLRADWNTWANYIGFIYLETAEYGASGSLFADDNRLQINHGSASAVGTTTIETNTTYHIWLEWNRGTGANGIMDLFVSTNVIKPSVPEASITTGNGGAVERIYFGSFSAGFDVVIDSLFIDDQPIGSNPEGNLAPNISDLLDQTINEDSSTIAIPFLIEDVEGPALSLTLAGTSSNTNLVPNANIVFGGSDSNRTVIVTPAPNQFGTATITVSVRDNLLSTNDTFVLTVNPTNDEPVATLPGVPANFTEGAGPVVLNAAATIIDIDSPTLGGGLLSISITGNPSSDDRLSVRNLGNGPGEIEVSGIGVAYGGVGIGTFTGGTSGSTPLVISFNSSATPAAAQALLRNISFENISTTPSILPRTVSVLAEDGQGGISVPVTMTVNVTSMAENPTVDWPTPLPILYGTPLTSLQQNATANVPGDFNYTPAAGTVLNAGAGQILSVTFTPTDLVNYNPVTTTVQLTITPAALLVTADARSKVYGSANPTFTATLAGFVNGDTEASLDTPVTLTTTADVTSPAGNYDIVPAGAADANYTVSFTNGSLTVTPAALTVTADNAARPYGQTNPLFTATLAGFVNGDDQADLLGSLAFSTPAETNSPIGTYAITPSGLTSPNYTVGFVDGALAITPYALVVTADNQTKLYGADLPALTGSVAGVHNGDGITATFTTIATAASNTGAYPITAILADPNNQLTNYTVSLVNGSLTVTPAALTVTADNAARPYGQTNPLFTATLAGFVNGDDQADLLGSLAFSTPAETNSPIGTYAITPSGLTSPNYVITHVDGTLTVEASSNPPSISILSADALGNATMRITGDPGQRIKIQASVDLTTWVDLTTVINATGTLDYTDPAAPDRPHRFYRAVLAPQ